MTQPSFAHPAPARSMQRLDDAKQFRRALGAFATGVVVVTARTKSGLVGLTMNSFASVSLDPPLISFNIANTAYSLPLLRDAEGYAVNVLANSMQTLSATFARAGEDKWRGVGFESDEHGAPLLHGALAVFSCTPHAVYEAGDHQIFLGRVVAYSQAAGEPLIFHAGSYRRLAEGDEPYPTWPLGLHY